MCFSDQSPLETGIPYVLDITQDNVVTGTETEHNTFSSTTRGDIAVYTTLFKIPLIKSTVQAV